MHSDKKKILIVANVAKTHINTFHLPFIKMMKERGHQVDVLCVHDAEVKYCDHQIDAAFKRNPFYIISTLRGAMQVRKLVKENHYDVVHSHTPVGGVVARLGCIGLDRKKLKVIYQVHGLHFFKGAPLHNWIIFFPVEWILSFVTDVLITINEEDYQFANKHLHAKKLEYIPGVGVDLEKFREVEIAKADKRKELGIPENAHVLFTAGELIKRKNHVFLLHAFSRINDKDTYLLIAGKGPEEKNLKKLSEKLGIEDRTMFLGFRSDIPGLCKASDIFVFPSKQEGLPKALMEAMATGLPCAVSKIRGNEDLIDENGGALFSPKDLNSCVASINMLLEKDSETLNRMGRYNQEKTAPYEELEVLKQVLEIYQRDIR